MDGKSAAPAQAKHGVLSKEQSATLAAVLNTIPQDTLDSICKQNGVDKDGLIQTTNVAIAPSVPEGQVADGDHAEEDDEGEGDEIMHVDYTIAEEDVDARLKDYVAAGFEEKENEEKAARHARLQAWADEKREEHRRQARAIKSQQKALGVTRRVQKAKR